MNNNEPKIQLSEIVNLAMDSMGVSVSIIDAKGILI
jgi:hypothetical protein